MRVSQIGKQILSDVWDQHKKILKNNVYYNLSNTTQKKC